MINLQNIKSLEDLNLKLDPVMDANAGLTAEDLAMTQQILDTLDEIEQMMEQYNDDYEEEYEPITYKDIIEMMKEWRIVPLLNKYNIKICCGDKFCAYTEKRIVMIPKEIDADMAESLRKVIVYINEYYGTDLNPNSINDICLFPVLHEIGHIVDKNHSFKQDKKAHKQRKKLIDKRDKKLDILFKLDDILYSSYWMEYDEEKPDTMYDKIMKSIIRWNNKQIEKINAKCKDKYRRIPQERFADQYAVNQIFTGQYSYCGL